ncbi:MAG: phosphoribosylanthranilate isomerase [Dysgonamonadaceae bacterium]|jgi:phosphoribosylanthranilate isomerase|nr:phosphoribosylanthranilate isomerase [Dysgonamonadaceae bacterium]
MKIKVCGMTNPQNIRELVQLPVDMAGLIFYEKSSRYAGNLSVADVRMAPPSIWKVGVFVNATEKEIEDKMKRYHLQAIQLHGNETPDFCKKIKEKGMIVIKAFSISEEKDLNHCDSYSACCDYFLFDTKTPQYGGSGKQFDWKIIETYQSETPFFLSGGISPNDAERISEIRHPSFYGIDLNSRFETMPGIKNIDLLRTFIQTLKK